MKFEPDPWLGQLFGYPVFRVAAGGDLSPRDQSPTDIPALKEAFVYARVPCAEIGQVNELLKKGFRVVDTALRFRRKVSAPGLGEKDQTVRDAKAADFGPVMDIAGECFRYSRFHLDPLVPRPLADAIKRAWMDSYRLGKRGCGCLVAERAGKVAGFLAVLDSSGEKATRVIDLIGVRTDEQGSGVGRALVESFVQRAWPGAQELEVGTQAANVPSVRLYEACGFRFAEAAYVLHAHFQGGRAV